MTALGEEAVTDITAREIPHGDEVTTVTPWQRASARLANLLARIKADQPHPKGNPGYQWNEEYPAQYMAARDCLSESDADEDAHDALCDLVHKIEAEAAYGKAVTGRHGWRVVGG